MTSRAVSGVGVPVAPRHRFLEDVQALLTGSLLAALGVVLFQQAHLVSGGTVGLALLLHYMTGLSLGWALLVANAPFYVLACLRMGREFTVKTLLSVTLTAGLIAVLPQGIVFQWLSPVLAAVIGGTLCGVGMLVLFRHTASLGGFNVLVLYLQQRFGWSPGKVQMVMDSVLVGGGALWAGDLLIFLASILAVVVLNLVIAANHRPGRYHPG
jgi:uncharacterized membrane-anchored protein YitT (DUF2179 family)